MATDAGKPKKGRRKSSSGSASTERPERARRPRATSSRTAGPSPRDGAPSDTEGDPSRRFTSYKKSQSLEPEVLPSDEAGTESPDEEFDPTEDIEILPEGSGALVPAGRDRLPPSPPPDATEDLPAVSTTDPVRRYFQEVSRYPLIDPEEEIELARRMRDDGDIGAAKRLVQANLRLVVKIAMEYQSVYVNLLDLIQEGNIGLMKAVSKFDPAKGARLSYYASWWIRSYILKYLLDNFRLVKIGTTQAQKKLFYHLMREQQRLEAQGLLPAPKLLAEKLDVREKDVVEMQQRLSGGGAEVSLDTPLDSSGETSVTHLDFLESDSEGIDETLARQQMLELLKESLPKFEKTLNEKERRVLKDRILAEDPQTLQEVADRYGLTRERVRQIEAKVILKLREFLTPTIQGSFEPED